jgi:hypothetical protein
MKATKSMLFAQKLFCLSSEIFTHPFSKSSELSTQPLMLFFFNENRKIDSFHIKNLFSNHRNDSFFLVLTKNIPYMLLKG